MQVSRLLARLPVGLVPGVLGGGGSAWFTGPRPHTSLPPVSTNWCLRTGFTFSFNFFLKSECAFRKKKKNYFASVCLITYVISITLKSKIGKILKSRSCVLKSINTRGYSSLAMVHHCPLLEVLSTQGDHTCACSAFPMPKSAGGGNARHPDG